MLKVGIIGLGKMGLLHMMNALKIEGVEVVAAADGSKRALGRAKSAGISTLYPDYRDLLQRQSGIDAVIISLPNFLHFDSTRLALESGLDVFIEKPMANTTEECREIVRLVQKSGRKVMVGHCFRFVRAIEKMKSLVDESYIGNLKVATIEEVMNGPFSHGKIPSPVPEWWFDPKKSGGGVLLDLGYHMIDLFRFFAGEAEVTSAFLDHNFNLPIEDGAIVILRSPSTSTRGIINVGWYQKTILPRFNFRAILHGSAGYLSTEELVPRNLYLHAVKEGTKNLARRIAGRRIHPLSYTYYYEPYYKELAHFLDCVKNDRDPQVSANDGLKTVEIIQEAYAKSRQVESN